MRVFSLLLMVALLAACRAPLPSDQPVVQPTPTAVVQGPPAPTAQPTTQPTAEARVNPAARAGETVQVIDRPRHVAVTLDCKNGFNAKLYLSVLGIGPGAADIVGIGLLKRGNWSYIVSGDPCNDGRNEVHGWVSYPADGAERVIFTMWQSTEPFNPAVHGAEKP